MFDNTQVKHKWKYRKSFRVGATFLTHTLLLNYTLSTRAKIIRRQAVA